MTKSLDLSILETLSEDLSLVNLNVIGKVLLEQIKDYLELDPYFQNVEISIIDNLSGYMPKFEDIFTIGANKAFKNDTVVVEVYSEYEKYYPFILLREIYNIFVPLEIVNYESIQLVINQILLVDLEKNQHVNEWRSLIRGNIEQYDFISRGTNRLTSFDLIANFFKLVQIRINPTRFFFHYIRGNKFLLSEKFESRDFDIHDIFFEELEKKLEEEIINDDLVETIRSLIKIFYNTKSFSGLSDYKSLFQKFKKDGRLNTNLSLRNFMKNMEWIKTSIIAPSYQLNYIALNLIPLTVYLQFNPLLITNKILKLIENIPFLINSLYSSKSFGLDILAIFIIPKAFLDDLNHFIRRLENFGYVVHKYYVAYTDLSEKTNLNYLKKYAQSQLVINPTNPQYEIKNEIETVIDNVENLNILHLNILDFIILDRIQWYSVTGIGFERRIDLLQSIKLDLINDIISERAIIENLKHLLKEVTESSEMKEDILDFIKLNKKFGFFYIKEMLEKNVIIISILEEILNKNPGVKNIIEFQELIHKSYITYLIEKNILLNDTQAIKIILKEIFSFYFKSKTKYYHQVEKYRLFNQIFSLFSNIKMFSLDSIEKIVVDQELINYVFKSKETRLKKSYEKYKPYQITNQKIEEILNKFLGNKPPIIFPRLVNTIPFSKYINDHIELFIVYNSENVKKLKEIENLFPRFRMFSNRNKNIIIVDAYLPLLTRNEKRRLFSFFYNTFHENILLAKSFLTTGYLSAFSLKHFYDFEGKKFFYSKDLFEQYFLYVNKILGDKLKPTQSIPKKYTSYIRSKEEDLTRLIEIINNRCLSELKTHSISSLNELLDFNSKIEEILLDKNKYKEIKQRNFFKNYIKSIKIIPEFSNFGFSQYFLYLIPINVNKLDLRALLLNTFLKIKIPIHIGDSNAFLINYIMPYRRPNRAYLNRIVKSDRIVREYCLFSIKKVYTILHFDYNLDSNGWKYNIDKFKLYMQNILFNANYSVPSLNVREFKVSTKAVSSYFGPADPEYKALTQLYNRDSIDIKSYIGTRDYNKINAIKELINKKLIFPYIKLKNLNLHNKILIILPNIKPEYNSKIIRIFNYFNYVFIYEIQGEYFINGFSDEINFENGLMIKLYLPIHKHNDFVRSFDLLFEYLEIDRYLIINDLINEKDSIESIDENLKSTDSYNPLMNLIWDEKDKVWMNHKLYTKEFKKIYPDLKCERDNSI